MNIDQNRAIERELLNGIRFFSAQANVNVCEGIRLEENKCLDGDKHSSR